MKKKAFIPISALVGALLLVIIATMTPFVTERNLAYAQTNSDIATLSRLAVSPGTLSPAFNAAALSVPDGGAVGSPHLYTVNVPNSVDDLTVTAIKTDRNASVAYTVNGGTPGTSGRIELDPGPDNVVLVTVTAEDATTQKFYQVAITRAVFDAADDATLSELMVTPAEGATPRTDAVVLSDLDEKFAHTVDLTNAEDSVSINPDTSETGAVVTVKKGSEVIAASTVIVGTYDVDIDVGDNTITVDVLALDFETKETYTLTINRARRNASDDDTLRSLSLSQGMLMPAFDPANLPSDDGNNGMLEENAHPYDVSVPRSVFEVTVMAATTDSRAKWEVTAPPDSDDTRNGHQVNVRTATLTTPIEIMIMVTAENRLTPKFYQVDVARAAVAASTGATLSVLTVAPGMTNPATLGTKFEYSIDLPYDFDEDDEVQNEVNITATVSEDNAGAVVTVKKGSEVIAASTVIVGTYDVDIDVGDNTITVDVLAADFVATKTYTLTINRARQNASDDARLSSLSLRGGTLIPAFDAADLPADANAADDETTHGTTALLAHAYTARVTNSVESLTVIAGAINSSAMVSITNNGSSVSAGAVDLVVGENEIDITVTAEDRTTASMKHYQVTVTRAGSGDSTDATLSELMVTPAEGTAPRTAAVVLSDLDKKFAHTVDLTNAEDNVEIGIGTTATGAVVTVKKGSKVIAADETDATYDVDIDEGDNTITVEVLPPSFVAAQKKTYTLTINRASRNASDDARLSSLSLSDGMLMRTLDDEGMPAGNGDATGTPHLYQARVANSVESLTVMAEAMSSAAMVSITNNGSSVSAGAVDLVVGGNDIDITVTAEDRTSMKYYQVTVIRVAATASSNADLVDLSLGMPNVTLDPAFDADNLPALMGGAHHFSASASRGSDDIRVVPTIADSGATVTVMSSTTDGAINPVEPAASPPAYEVDLEVGDNVITVMVTAENVITTKTYKITINRAGTGNAALSDLSLSGLILNEPFGTAADDAYTADAANSIDSTTVTATPEQSNATVEIMPRDADSAMDGHQVALTPGSNTIIVTVTAGDNTREYTVKVTVPSSDATLKTLALSDITLSPAFDPATTTYTAEVLNTVEMTTVEAAATHPDATVEGTGDESLTLGENTVEVTVTAEDGTTTMTYTVMVTVTVPSSDASLTSLSLMDGMGMDITLVAGVEAHWNTLDCPAMNDRVGADDQPDDMNSPYCRMYDGLDDEAKAVVDATYDEDPIEGFMSDINMYYASAANDVDMVTVSAMAMPGATVSGDVGAVSLDVGENTITVTVTAEDGTTMMTYTVMVTVLSSDATLESLTLSGLTLDQAFDSATTEYTATVDASVEATTVSATATHPSATIIGAMERCPSWSARTPLR